jgi:hypothetical protein
LHLTAEGIANRVKNWEKGRNNTFDGRLLTRSQIDDRRLAGSKMNLVDRRASKRK